MNYSKMVKQIIWKMAMPLALMFAACSTDDGNTVVSIVDNPGTPVEMGGSSEEPNIIAKVDTIVLKGRAGNVYPRMLLDAAQGSSVGGKTTYSPRGTVVSLYELDPVTLDVSERFFVDTIDNDSGLYAFDDVVVQSPYALIVVRDRCITDNCRERGTWYEGLPIGYDGKNMHVDSSGTYTVIMTAIVDLQKTQYANVNALTDAKVPLVRKYYAEGTSFEEASKKAEREVLENLGIYEGFEDFEKIDSENEELPFVLGLLSIKSSSYGCSMDFETYLRYRNVPSEFYSDMGGVMGDYYWGRLKMLDYEVGCLAHEMQLDRCDESRENESNEFVLGFLDHYSLVCHSNKWRAGYRKIDYVGGTMVDARDGKTYRTVEYNWRGKKQTWMAENLNYEGVEKSACYESDPDCKYYGRFYAWQSAMNLAPSSVEVRKVNYEDEYDEETDTYNEITDTLIVEDACASKLPMNRRGLNAFVEAGNSGVWSREPDATYDSAKAYCDEKYTSSFYYLNLSKFMPQSAPVRHQGICPDGWRIPNDEDWQLLLEMVKGLYGEGNATMVLLLKDEEATGFGYMTPVSFRVKGDPNNPASAQRRDTDNIVFATVPDFGSDDYSQAIYYSFVTMVMSKSISSYSYNMYYDLNSVVSVRCIKND